MQYSLSLRTCHRIVGLPFAAQQIAYQVMSECISRYTIRPPFDLFSCYAADKMSNSFMAQIAQKYRDTQDALLERANSLTDEQLTWTPNRTTPCIGFHLWHTARWADYLQEIIHGQGNQLWEQEGIAARWDMATASLGYAQTGMSMDDRMAMRLKIPAKALLLDYASRAFALAQQAVSQIEDANFYRVYECLHGENWHDGQIGPIILTWMTHDNRHLGMIECLIGIQGMPGTADS